jgi:hypothetical protein
MSGQSATLSLKEAKAMQERICAHGTSEHQGPKSGSDKNCEHVCEKVKHQG